MPFGRAARQFGSTNWPPPAYSPDTGLLYVPTSETYAMYYLTETDPRGAMGLGGKDEVTNLKMIKLRTYIEILTKVWVRVRDLPADTPINSIKLHWR